MGMHLCPFENDENCLFDATSSGDVTMKFRSGRTWTMPDMIIHYIADHGWQPPAEFVEDVLSLQMESAHRLQTKAATQATQIGYLTTSEPFERGPVSWEFVGKLAGLMQRAQRLGNRSQTRGG